MAKKALLDVLEQTIGKYVKNLDAESLNVAVWSGKIELNALELNCDAVNLALDRQAAETPNLAIPFKVVGGQFRSFQVDVPWAHLMSRPVVLRAQGLSVTVEPYDRTAQADFLHALHASEEERASKVQQMREKAMADEDDYRRKANAFRQLAAEDLDGGSNSPSATSNSNASFGARLVRRIIENIQVEISNVHIQLHGSESSAGIVLESLVLTTTDENGNVAFVDRTGKKAINQANSFLYKALRIVGLGVYMDEDEMRSSASLSKHKQQLFAIQENNEPDEPDHTYVLAPLSFEATLRQADSNACVEFPKYMLASELDSLSILLSKTQLELGHKIVEQIRPSEEAAVPLFPEYRPLQRVTKDTAREWWRYAYRCIGRMNGRRSWSEFILAFRRRKAYIPLYKRQAHYKNGSWLKPLTVAESEVIQNIEEDRSISLEGLMTWRNIADAQFEKERQKSDLTTEGKKGSLFHSLFGGNAKPKGNPDVFPSEEEPPVQLTVEEMKELEIVTMDQVADAELTDDSQLCDVGFTLGSFKIHLTSYNLSPVASLEMGTVTSKFKASADGSFDFDFSMSSLAVLDKVTVGTLFPIILQNQTRSDVTVEMDKAFGMRLAKTKGGDQDLKIRLNTFEAVASPILLRELKRFITQSQHIPRSKANNPNVLLRESISGSVDLFYDAVEANAASELNSSDQNVESSSKVVSDFSVAMIDAWKTKTETKASWTVDFNIQAPIVIVPENCVDSRANVLIFDLGHLQMKYGKTGAGMAQQVEAWFRNHPRPKDNRDSDSVIDCGSLSITSLTFMVGKANYWRRLVRKHEEGGFKVDNDAVIEPISILIDLGIESYVGEHPRVCVFGVIPSVSVGIAPSQLSRILVVFETWAEVANDLFSDGGPEHGLEDDLSATSSASGAVRLLETARRQGDTISSSMRGAGASKQFLILFVSVNLQQLSFKLLTDTGNGVEAHLVSVSLSSSVLSNGGTILKLSMGWFWVLDRSDNDFPRQQRLIAHSKLPDSDKALPEESRYDILGGLRKIGAFQPDFSGLESLADITFTINGAQFAMQPDLWTLDNLGGVDLRADSVLDAKFTTLCVNWNPQVVKVLTVMLSKFTLSMDSSCKSEAGSLLIASSPSRAKRRYSASSGVSQEQDRTHDQTFREKTVLVRAEMESLSIVLNSARDDRPLFTLTMSASSVHMLSGAKDARRLNLVLGDIKVVTPETSRTNSLYRTILGLAPEQSESLLTIEYREGEKAMESRPLEGVDTAECEAYADIMMSPMRIVYIHAQVLSLLEYATDGILGALTAHMASSAAAAAAEMASPSTLSKVFCVHASGLEIVLPQAAYAKGWLSLEAGGLSVHYTTLPSPGGGKADVKLSNVMLRDALASKMQEETIEMIVQVYLQAEGVGSKDDQATVVNIDVPTASFIVSSAQYTQILATLDQNFGESNLFLREDAMVVATTWDIKNDCEARNSFEVTHAGANALEKETRTYLDLKIGTFSVELCGTGTNDPLIRVAALAASVSLKLLSDEQRTLSTVFLRNLVCDDRRFSAAGRQYRSLVYQDDSVAAGRKKEGADLFSISYEGKDDATILKLRIGSPRLVFIPDAVAEVISFVGSDGKDSALRPKAHEETLMAQPSRETVEISSEENHDPEAEADFAHRDDSNFQDIVTLTFEMTTDECSVIFVDLGSVGTTSGGSLVTSSAAETFVLGGRFSTNVVVERLLSSGKISSADVNIDVDYLEAYTAFGENLSSPLQVLDPTRLSLHISTKADAIDGQKIDIRAAAVEPVDICLSMRNAALLNAILISFLECFDDMGTEPDEETIAKSLSVEQAARIQELASELDKHALEDTSQSDPPSSLQGPEVRSISSQSERSSSMDVLSLKITMPETKVTFVNDLQGLDEALIRLVVRNFAAGGQWRRGVIDGRGGKSVLFFDLSIHTSLLSDFFDSSVQTWKTLLDDPWELSLTAKRGISERFNSFRPSTTLDIESFPCHVSFSEHFLMSLASAKRMWSVYSTATESGTSSTSCVDKSLPHRRRSIAASAARTFVSALPYALENHSGLEVCFVIPGQDSEQRRCSSSSIEYFRFDPPSTVGSGGKRLYGQDVSFAKEIVIYIANSTLAFKNLDDVVDGNREARRISDGTIVFVEIRREGKTTVLHLSSGFDIHNATKIPFAIGALTSKGEVKSIGICRSQEQHTMSTRASLIAKDGQISKSSRRFGLPVDFLKDFRESWNQSKRTKLEIVVAPDLVELSDDVEMKCFIEVAVDRTMFAVTDSKLVEKHFDVYCVPTDRFSGERKNSADVHPFGLHVRIQTILVDDTYLAVRLLLEPRATIENRIPVCISVKTPMPYTFSRSVRHNKKDSTHELQPNTSVEIFTPGPSIAVSVNCADLPIGGTTTDWMEGGWIDLPLVAEYRLPEPIRCQLPFDRRTAETLGRPSTNGTEFFIAEGDENLAMLSSIGGEGRRTTDDKRHEVENALTFNYHRCFYVTVCNFAVDHTGDILFEQMESSERSSIRRSATGIRNSRSSSDKLSTPFGAFRSQEHNGRVSLLPNSKSPIRLLHLTMEGDEGLRRSSAFMLDDISICEGGVDATPLRWNDGTLSGFFAYRRLVNSYQSELHVVPEYVVYNGSSTYSVAVRQYGGIQKAIQPGAILSLSTHSGETASISLEYKDFDGRTSPLRIDSLGLRVAIVKRGDGQPIGSIALQTVVGAQDSRLVVKLGEFKMAKLARSDTESSAIKGSFDDDFLRFRIQWSELRVTMNEARPGTKQEQAFFGYALDQIMQEASPLPKQKYETISPFTAQKPCPSSETWVEAHQRQSQEELLDRSIAQDPICSILFHRFTIDWQRVFKDEEKSTDEQGQALLKSPERSQLSVIVHNVQIRDETINSPYPIVLDSSSEASFFDLCIRCRGSLEKELIKIDLVDLNLAHSNGISQKIIVNTSETFVWKMLDLADRILAAAGEFGSYEIKLTWDDEHDGYSVSIQERRSSYIDTEASYTPPESDTLLDIKHARVSPFTMVVSFKRTPEASRYRIRKGVRGGNLMNYFTRRLKFKIEKAELKFSRYEATGVKGPPDRLIELLSTVYFSRVKLKLVTIMTAASFQDWKFLAARDGGDDEFVEGDILRVTGNIAGNTADYVLKKAGKGLGSGVSALTSKIGGGIESATGAVGARSVGVGVNSFVSGVGEGVGDTISGVGSGAGQILKGAGQGVGHVFGGGTRRK
jgi:hypothetical protein